MTLKHWIGVLSTLLIWLSCTKDTPVINPTEKGYELYISNSYNELTAQYVVWLTDADGIVRASRSIPGNDTVLLQVPASQTTDVFDCTVAKITALETGGAGGLRDTFVELTTYTRLAHGESIKLKDPEYRRITEVSFALSNLSQLDSVMFSSAIPFLVPKVANNFTGTYRVLHSGSFWMRIKVNGEAKWRFLSFENINVSSINLGNLNVGIMPVLFASPLRIDLPFTTDWRWNVEGIIDTATAEYFPLGDLLRAPGGAVPILNYLDIYQPVTNDVFFPPPPKPYNNGYRVQGTGKDGSTNGYTYHVDQFFDTIPPTLPLPDWDLQSTTLANGRLIAVRCIGDFNVLAFGRTRSTNPYLNWEVLMPHQEGVVSYRLPDVPTELANQFPVLKNYQFDNAVRARAESYARFGSFQSIVRQQLRGGDLLWRAKAGYLAKEKTF